MKVFFFDPRHPTRVVKEADVTIKKGKKRVWAVLDGKRRLLGSTIFFTEAAARRSQRGALQEKLKDDYVHRYLPRFVRAAEMRLATLH